MMMRAEPAPAASRKRAREKELTQSQRERLDDEKVLKAEKAVKRARAVVERADKAGRQADRGRKRRPRGQPDGGSAAVVNRSEKSDVGYLMRCIQCLQEAACVSAWMEH